MIEFLKKDFRYRLDHLHEHPSPSLSPYHGKVESYFLEIFYCLENLPMVLKSGHTVFCSGASKSFSTRESLIRLLNIFCVLRNLILSNEIKEAPVCVFADQIVSFLIPAICKECNQECTDLVSIPMEIEAPNQVKAMLICIKAEENWVTSFNITSKNKPQYSFVPIAPHRGLLLDLSFQPIDHPCIHACFQTDTLDEATLNRFLECLKSPGSCCSDSEISIRSQFTYYISAPKENKEPNAFSFSVLLYPNGTYQIQAPQISIDPNLLSRCIEQISAYTDMIKNEVIHKLKSEPYVPQSLCIFLPSSENEIRRLEHEILAEIAKNPEEHLNVIEWLIETYEISLPEEPGIEEVDEILVTPQKAIELLIEAQPHIPSIDARLAQEDKVRKQELEKAAARTPSKKPNRQKKHQGKTKVKPKEKAAPEKQTKQSLILSADERSQVRQVMQGHSMKGDEFVKFGLALLKRKVEKLNVRQAGSHINAAKQTLVKIHRNGRKDTQGMVSHQKSFLREVLSPSDN